MENVVDECLNEQTAGKERISLSVTRLRKYTYVLPSGRTLKVLQYDENDLVKHAA